LSLQSSNEAIRRFQHGGREVIASRNLNPGRSVYGEKLVKRDGIEYRLWSPYRSKLSAAILRSLTDLPLSDGSMVLYLGAGAGTTASHVSDIVGKDGMVYCVEFAPKPMKELLRVSESRMNMVPILADARHPESYAHFLGEVDFVYQDVAQPNQGEIFKANAQAYLAPRSWGLLMIKSRSVDVAREPEEVFTEEIGRLAGWGFKIAGRTRLDPYDKDHIAISLSNG
jgi:fibrillarin-like pre-rRNA processing protein